MLSFLKDMLGTFCALVVLIILCLFVSLFIDIIVAFLIKIGGVIFMFIVMVILASMLITLMNR